MYNSSICFKWRASFVSLLQVTIYHQQVALECILIAMVQTTEVSGKPYIHDYGARLSEGVSYLKESQTLIWVDIFLSEIHLVTNIDDPKSSHKVVKINYENYIGEYPCDKDLPERVGVVFPVDSASGVKDIFFASKYGIGRLSLETAQWKYEVLFSSCEQTKNKDWKRLRSNDGNVAPNGDLYVGVMLDFHIDMDRSAEPEGCFLRVDLKKRAVELVMDGLHIPNAINWNPKKDTIFLTDSLNYKIWTAPYDSHSGLPALAQKKSFIEFKPLNSECSDPEPDGSCIDPRNGNLYSAVFSSHKVQLFDSQGTLQRNLVFPDTANVTCCCLGPGGDLFVTTASRDVLHGVKTSGPNGALFRVAADLVSDSGDVPSSKPNPAF
ncbi:regucalcin [Lachancea thermotolerans CBS 6340]|uniref:KLTH0C07546p n=1 Tax=Lachancea thermotolerans (strain ATCC 56472 / CBS 6340 / NRRL Y-8284) TaxID=559295 RepID=C5DEA3_LACTC|nr:KLTH0C07546p [Lachancea thermotolerans CBS 6340]CAR22114.1 KLTH0C07546p [Lachancea thermotolerans CBS 6340]